MTSEFVHREAGDLLGIRLVVAGHPGEAASGRFWRLRSGLLVRAKDTSPILLSELRALDAIQFICLVSSIASFRFTRPQELRDLLERAGLHRAGMFREYQMAYAIMVLLTNPQRGSWEGVPVSPIDLANVCNMVSHVVCRADRESQPGISIRIAYQQFWDQEDYSYWKRGLLLARELPRALEKSGFSLGDAIQSVLRISLDEFLFLGFALFAEITAQPGRTFGVDQFAGSKDFNLPRETVETFLDVIALDFDQYGSKALQWAEPGFEVYNFNPLLGWPAVLLPNGRVTVPIPRLLLQRLTFGLYYDLLQSLPEPDRGRFGDLWGQTFETYVGRLMDGLAGFPLVLSEQKYTRNGREVVSCDWLVRDGDLAIAIECKTRGLSLRSRVTGSENALRNDVSRALTGGTGSTLAGGVAKLFETRRDILHRSAGLEPLHGVAEVICVLVTLDQMYCANHDGYLYQILTEEAVKLSPPGDAPAPYQVTDIVGFETLCRVVHGTSASAAQLLQDKLAQAESRQMDFQLYFPQLMADQILPEHPLHEALGEQAMDELVTIFRTRQ